MSVKALYQKVILDHNKTPRNTGILIDADIDVADKNPVCGDEIRLTLAIREKRVKDIRFEARGCALSIASASMLTELIVGRPLPEAEQLTRQVIDIFKGKIPVEQLQELGDFEAMKGVLDFPARIKCVLMCWQALADGFSYYTV